jgi:hypothetical protein
VEYTDLTIKTLEENRKDLVESLRDTATATKLSEEIKTLKETLATKETEATTLKAELETIKAQEAKTAKTLAISNELKAANLDASKPEVVSAVFMEMLEIATDEAARKRLIEDRQKLLKLTTVTPEQDSPPFGSAAPLKESVKVAATMDEFLARL